ncbi:MAG: NAD(P)/FAD-dependent oxidoreductase [Methylococcales bacterium]|jgi:predicted Rossmann fold flavoprotein|nr:NAD(P)/FAD-dependent oxidoreductase [Methylococcales bacterium]MBT7444465.1 NAD(P)/FAD-dependent oxidoreductase [Methylococcales bacterium]
MNKPDVIIIGAGASGLMCAITAGKKGLSVVVLDSSNKVGKKILMSGGGRCNFTNMDVTPDNYLSNNPHFCKSALNSYTQWDFIAWVCEHNIEYHERENGELFCDHSAKDILNMLLTECDAVNVKIHTHCDIKHISHSDSEYLITSNLGEFRANAVVVATGGLSIPKMGATGFGHQIAKQFNLDVLPTSAGLVPFTLTDPLKSVVETLSGIAIPATVSCNNTSFTGSLLFTHRGLSGPIILQLSNYWHLGDPIEIDLLPSADIETFLHQCKAQQPKKRLRTLLSSQLPKSLVHELEALFWPSLAEKPIGELSKKALSDIAHHLSHWKIKPSGTEGYRTAEVTLGGVNTDALSSKTFEVKSQPGLYFIGEVIDVTGHLGGYNFQWAWASGYACGQAV